MSTNWKLHHENATFYTCFVVTEHLTKKDIVTIPQSPYSPDLAPEELFLFPKGLTVLKGRFCGTLDDVKRADTHTLKDVSVGDFQGAYAAWKRSLQKMPRKFLTQIEIENLMKNLDEENFDDSDSEFEDEFENSIFWKIMRLN
ncbi:HTH_48 domain-containing protein [Trichonephila clavipes]|nr:HTH_48 domain-containing protein [Trichonephila clavipes]